MTKSLLPREKLEDCTDHTVSKSPKFSEKEFEPVTYSHIVL